MPQSTRTAQTTRTAPVPRILAVGVGSPHGDDQIGWVVVRELARLLPGELDVKTVDQPASLLDCLHDAGDVERLIVCDACQTGGPAGELHRWTWPAASLATRERSGSHDLTLPFVLALAERLGRLPPQVDVWGVELQSVAPGGRLGVALEQAVPTIVRTIADEIRNQRDLRETRRHA